MQKKARIVAGSGAQQMNGYGGVRRDGAGAASSCHRFTNHERASGTGTGTAQSGGAKPTRPQGMGRNEAVGGLTVNGYRKRLQCPPPTVKIAPATSSSPGRRARVHARVNYTFHRRHLSPTSSRGPPVCRPGASAAGTHEGMEL